VGSRLKFVMNLKKSAILDPPIGNCWKWE